MIIQFGCRDDGLRPTQHTESVCVWCGCVGGGGGDRALLIEMQHSSRVGLIITQGKSNST
jgi:hypothetical protein